jgi:hypothetical protein
MRYPAAANGAVSSVGDYEEYSYDPASNVTAIRRRDDTTVTLAYDALDRLIWGGWYDLCHDNLGRVTSASRLAKPTWLFTTRLARYQRE